MVEKKFTREHPQPPPLKVDVYFIEYQQTHLSHYTVFSYNPNPESLKHFVFQFDKANLDKNQKSDDHPPHPSNDVINGLEVNFYP